MRKRVAACAGLIAAVAAVGAAWTASASAQGRPDWEWDGNYYRLPRLARGTLVTVRTIQRIERARRSTHIYPAVVAEDVWDDYGRLTRPAIPRGSRVDLVVRTARDGDLILDLDAIYAYGERYAVSAAPERVEGGAGRRGEEAAAYIAGGAILGTIIGSIAGGEKGAAIGAAAGTAAGAGLAFRGPSIRVPAGAVLTFRLDEGLDLRAPPHRSDRR
jgi:hypothetical protein